MNDRELLELAAKAVGEDVEWHESGSYFYRKSCNWPAEKGFFNPRHDDGESRRLAVKLRMCVSVEHDAQAAVWQGDELLAFNEPLGDDECAAVRLAVLRCAAEIGRAMP